MLSLPPAVRSKVKVLKANMRIGHGLEGFGAFGAKIIEVGCNWKPGVAPVLSWGGLIAAYNAAELACRRVVGWWELAVHACSAVFLYIKVPTPAGAYNEA
jgi:hypothetical protein